MLGIAKQFNEVVEIKIRIALKFPTMGGVVLCHVNLICSLHGWSTSAVFFTEVLCDQLGEKVFVELNAM